MKQQHTLIGVVIIIVIILAGFYFSSGPKQAVAPATLPMATSTVDTRVETNSLSPLDVRNATYTIEGQSMTLVDGASQVAIPNSSAVVKTAVLEGPAFADLNEDGINDAVVILRQETGGSGIFFFVSVLLSKGSSSTGVATNAIMIGDRIHIQSIDIDQNGIISVTILDRKDSDPFSATPTVEKTFKYRVVGTTLVPAN
jgi:hypothetical protein